MTSKISTKFWGHGEKKAKEVPTQNTSQLGVK